MTQLKKYLCVCVCVLPEKRWVELTPCGTSLYNSPMRICLNGSVSVWKTFITERHVLFCFSIVKKKKNHEAQLVTTLACSQKRDDGWCWNMESRFVPQSSSSWRSYGFKVPDLVLVGWSISLDFPLASLSLNTKSHAINTHKKPWHETDLSNLRRIKLTLWKCIRCIGLCRVKCTWIFSSSQSFNSFTAVFHFCM